MDSNKAKKRSKQFGLQARYNNSEMENLRNKVMESRARIDQLSGEVKNIESEIDGVRRYNAGAFVSVESTSLQFLYLSYLESTKEKLSNDYFLAQELESTLVGELGAAYSKVKLYEGRVKCYSQIYARRISKLHG